MRRPQKWLGVLAVLPLLAYGGIEQDRLARIQRIEKAVLAPCCYTENVGLHQSEVAVKMRVEIANWVGQGKTDQEILDTYTQRYGAKVLVDPNTLPKGYEVLVPWAVAGVGALGLLWMLKRWHANRSVSLASAVDGATLPDIPDFDED
jgi:cytochrome c-type biogenesis protein CcmH/NrfF